MTDHLTEAAKDSLAEYFEGAKITYWCSFCNSEPAIDTVGVMMYDREVELPIGENCFVRVSDDVPTKEEYNNPS